MLDPKNLDHRGKDGRILAVAEAGNVQIRLWSNYLDSHSYCASALPMTSTISPAGNFGGTLVIFLLLRVQVQVQAKHAVWHFVLHCYNLPSFIFTYYISRPDGEIKV